MIRPIRPTRGLAAAAMCLMAGLLLLHLGLVPLGRWHPDEYFYFAILRQRGVLFLLGPRLAWSPRPLSELLLYGYSLLVAWSGRPLISLALAFAWGCLFAGTLAGALGWRGRADAMPRLLLALAVLAMFLLGHPIGEMFYWTAAALAYLPALAAVAFVTLRALTPLQTMRQRLAVSAGLVLASGSAELGAMFAACFAGLMLAVEIVRPRAARATGRHMLALSACWLVPLLFAGGVLGALARGRGGGGTEQIAGGPLFHHLGASLAAAVPQTARGLLLPQSGVAGLLAVAASLVSILLLFLGARCCLRAGWPQIAPRAQIAALALALLGGMFLSAAAADYQFATLCCERHDTFREALVVLLVVALAALSLPPVLSYAVASRAVGDRVLSGAAVLLSLAAAVPAVGRMPALAAEYRGFRGPLAARAATWISGQTPGPAPLLYMMAPPGPLFNYSFFTPGTYRLDAATPWDISGPMMFFGKPAMVVVQAGAPR